MEVSRSNRLDESITSHEQWQKALRPILSSFHLIVIGYNGNDGNVMEYLKALRENRKPIYWCVRGKKELLNKYFYDGAVVCVKVVNVSNYTSLFGGLATITDLSVEAPYDDAMTYSATFQGKGQLFDLTEDETATQMPKGYERPKPPTP